MEQTTSNPPALQSLPPIEAAPEVPLPALQLGSPARVASSADALSDAPRRAPPARSDPLAALSAEELNKLCSILYHVEESAQLRYEIRRQGAEKRGIRPPVEPRTVLSQEKRKELSRIAAEPRLIVAYADLEDRFTEPELHGADAPLPAPFQSLDEKARERASGLLSAEEHWRYAVALIRRANALLMGTPLPPKPETHLPEVRRQMLKKLLQDRRMVAYLTHLTDEPL